MKAISISKEILKSSECKYTGITSGCEDLSKLMKKIVFITETTEEKYDIAISDVNYSIKMNIEM
jgi:hypothetical protein